MSSEQDSILEEFTQGEYKYGFVSDIDTEFAPMGLNEDIVRFISAKKNEPEWMLEFRLKAFRHWLKMEEPRHWAHIYYPEIDFQGISYYAAPKKSKTVASMDEVDPELRRTFEKLGISLEEQKRLVGMESKIAVDAVIDSVSVKTTFKEVLAEKGIIF